MNKSSLLKWKMAASFACLLLIFAGSAPAQLTVTTSNQVGSAGVFPFTPTWTPASDSLIAGLAPTTATGNFSLEIAGRSVNSLTSGGSLTINQVAGTSGSTCSTNYLTYGNGSGAGSLLIYTLPAQANGYNITNITIDGGWANTGRDQQGYTVLYSTVANPTNFIFLAQANYNPSVPNNTPTANQVVINDASGAVIAANVYQVKFILNFPSVENGYCGIGAITVEGTAAPSVASVVTISASNQSGPSPFTPTFTAETPDLILGQSPSSSAGSFVLEGAGGIPVLTDGAIGTSGTISGFATCGHNGGTSLIYTLTNNPVNGSDVTNIVTYSGWGDGGRDGQYYTVSYSTVAAPVSFIPITTVYYLPSFPSGAPANRVAIYKNDGSPLASGVASIKFDFASPPGSGGFNNGYQGYSEIIVQGTNTAAPPPPPSAILAQDILPASAITVVGDGISFSAAYTNTPPVTVQWQHVSGGVTNAINTGVVSVTNSGVVTSTLTLNNLQLTDSGTYRLEGLNETNGAAAPAYSTGAPLVVNSLSAPVNNIIVSAANQTGLGALSPVNASTNFYPTWIVNTNNDLILGSVDGSTVIAGPGSYAVTGSQCNGDPVILSDGTAGYLNYWPNVGGSQTLDTLGVNPGGHSLTYTLPSNPNGWDITNITVYGGWGDGGRDEQKYQVLYSTVSTPTVFNALVSVDYLPPNPNGVQSATRTTIFSATTNALVHNVYAVEFNFNNQGAPPENGWEGYSEFDVQGVHSPDLPILTQDISPLTAEDVVGSQLIVTAAFTSDLALTYQWQKNGTNIPGQTSTTLTLNNLQLTDAATNGGYRLVAANSVGTSMTRGCTVTVDPAPAPVSNILTAFAFQTSDQATFGPTWDTTALNSSANLILNQNPPLGGYDQYFVVTTNGNVYDNFNDPDANPSSFNKAGGLAVLANGNYGNFANDGSHPAFATCGGGNGAGQWVNYILGNNTNGYDVTNIQIAGGWNDNGRDSQYYTVSYSTVANPMMFVPLLTVATNLSVPGYGVSDNTAIRATIKPAAGVLASNVYAIFVDFTVPTGVPNGYSGYSEISVFGSPSANPPPAGPVITVQHEETNNTFVLETPNLIANQLPSSFGPGVFTDEGCNETNLTSGVLGFGAAFSASCGDDGTAVPWIIFSSATGWNLTNIVTYTLWHDYGRDGQYYNLSYSTVTNPTTFVPLASVAYDPFVPHDGRASGNRVQIAPPVGQTLLASNVYAVMFDFTPQGIQDFGWSGYTQIVLQGSNLAPPTAPIISSPGTVGGQLVVSGTGGTPNYGFVLLTTTNLTTPLSSWTVSTNGVLNSSGAFSIAIPMNATNPASFFRLKME